MTEEHKQYLDMLRELGITNMFGAKPYLMARFPELSHTEAMNILIHWMNTFKING